MPRTRLTCYELRLFKSDLQICMIVTSIQLNDLRLFEWPVHIVKVGWEFKKQKKECHIFPFSKWVCLALQFTYAWVTYAYCQKWGGFQKKKKKRRCPIFPCLIWINSQTFCCPCLSVLSYWSPQFCCCMCWCCVLYIV